MEKHRFADQHEKDTDVHGIANVAMESSGDEEFCRRDRSGRTQSADCEFPSATKVYGRSRQQNCGADPSESAILWNRGATAQQPPRPEPEHSARGDDGEEQGA